MSAAEALQAASDAGVGLRVDGVHLVLEAPAPPPAAVLDLLSRHKADVIAVLRPLEDSWSAKDWLAFHDERAGIAEFDGGHLRERAQESPDRRACAFQDHRVLHALQSTEACENARSRTREPLPIVGA